MIDETIQLLSKEFSDLIIDASKIKKGKSISKCTHSEVCSADNQLIKRLNGDKCKHYNKKK